MDYCCIIRMKTFPQTELEPNRMKNSPGVTLDLY